jgi:probable rRNA maturation factor
MSELNQQYRGKDEPTDILSFVQEDGDEFPIFSENLDQSKPLGDMLISLQTMKRNCSEFSVSEGEELTRLMIHGVLHLLGWDHATNEGDEPMLQKQEELVKIVAKELHS